MRLSILVICLLSFASCTTLFAQDAGIHSFSSGSRLLGGGRIVTPQSSIQRAEDKGIRMRTHYKILVPAERPERSNGFSVAESTPKAIQPVSGYYAETPASLACLYGLVSATRGCNPAILTTVATGGSKAIAVVDAYDYPTALADLTFYSSQFGLPAPTSKTFTVDYQSGTVPSPDPNCSTYGGWNCWATESALDIEMAHVAAPLAHIFLVEADSNDSSDLYAAVAKAISLVQAAGGGEVSMSWGEGEYDTETSDDSIFTGTKVVFFASSGDSDGTEYPAVSPNVVAVGGTTISRNPWNLNFQGEISWWDGGGGYSSYEPRPAFQNAIAARVGSQRGTPDIAAIGNPETGVWVYNSYENTFDGTLSPWNILGGTSVGAPLSAAIVNHAGSFHTSTSQELSVIYSNANRASDYRDVVYGTCGYYQGFVAINGWDPCTGNGAPVGSAGK